MSNIDFIEERLELGIDYGAVGGFRFNTSIIETGDGGQQRNINWWLPLGRWQLGDRTLLESQVERIEEVNYLKEFHAARKGSYQGFRFRDWSDYQARNQFVAVADGQTIEYQLYKTYRAGQQSCKRPITKLVLGTIDVFFGLLKQDEGWLAELETGILKFVVPPASGTVITCNFDFDVPVWFESDAIGWRLEGYQEGEAIYRLESIFVEEGRIPLSLPWNIEPLPNLSEESLDLGIVYDTIETIEYQTSKERLKSGYLRRDSNYENPITKLNLGDRILDANEVEQLLGFFWCAKGQGQLLNFLYKDQTYFGRFDRDDISLKFEGYNTEDKLFYLSGLNITSTLLFQSLLNFIDSETYVITIIDRSGSMESSVSISLLSL